MLKKYIVKATVTQGEKVDHWEHVVEAESSAKAEVMVTNKIQKEIGGDQAQKAKIETNVDPYPRNAEELAAKEKDAGQATE